MVSKKWNHQRTSANKMLAGAMAFPVNFRAFSFNLFSFSDIGFQATFFKLTIGEDVYSMLQNLIYFLI